MAKLVLLVNPRKHRHSSFIGSEGKAKLTHDGNHFDHFESLYMKGDYYGAYLDHWDCFGIFKLGFIETNVSYENTRLQFIHLELMGHSSALLI